MRLCIVAGGGDLPKNLLEEALLKKQHVSVICIHGEADIKDFKKADSSINIGIGKIGEALQFLNQNNITHIVFAGSVKRPSLAAIRVDIEGAKLLALLFKEKFLGDDNLLRTVLGFFENKGFKILSASEILQRNNKISGTITQSSPTKKSLENIEVGKEAFSKIASLDVGQSLIISEKRIIAIEGAEGTDNMIKRSKEYVTADTVLLKMYKPSQDMRVDMPAIGVKTIINLHKNNIAGIAIDKNVIIVSMEETVDKANALGIYIHIIPSSIFK